LSEAAELVKKLEIDKLPVEKRIALIEAIWKSIDSRAVHVVLPSPAEIARFQRQMADGYTFEDDLFDPDEEEMFVFPPAPH
jgi:putative addiction module component (TIGR02574 family)